MAISDPDRVAAWRSRGFETPAQAAAWVRAGFDAECARLWVKAGVSITVVAEWSAYSVGSPLSAAGWRSLGVASPPETEAWVCAGVTCGTEAAV